MWRRKKKSGRRRSRLGGLLALWVDGPSLCVFLFSSPQWQRINAKCHWPLCTLFYSPFVFFSIQLLSSREKKPQKERTRAGKKESKKTKNETKGNSRLVGQSRKTHKRDKGARVRFAVRLFSRTFSLGPVLVPRRRPPARTSFSFFLDKNPFPFLFSGDKPARCYLAPLPRADCHHPLDRPLLGGHCRRLL